MKISCTTQQAAAEVLQVLLDDGFIPFVTLSSARSSQLHHRLPIPCWLS
jgi:hypothetical protein